MNIITGYKGEAHITAQMDRDINRGIFGDGAYVANLANGDTLQAFIQNANTIALGAGMIIGQGCIGEIPHGTNEAVTIQNGDQGLQRRDLITAYYKRASGTGVESMELRVIKGTPAVSNPVRPAYSGGNIVNGNNGRDFLLYEVWINGLTIERVERIAPVIGTMTDMNEQIESLESEIDGAKLIRRSFPFTIDYDAGTPGTRGARVTLTADYRETMGRSDLAIVGMLLTDFTASSNMHIELHSNGYIIYATAYRASAAAANSVTATAEVTFMQVS